jgi:hypothetical protein
MSTEPESNTPLPATQFTSWGSVRAAIDNLIASSPDPIDADVIANVRDLLSVCGDDISLPFEVGKG